MHTPLAMPNGIVRNLTERGSSALRRSLRGAVSIRCISRMTCVRQPWAATLMGACGTDGEYQVPGRASAESTFIGRGLSGGRRFDALAIGDRPEDQQRLGLFGDAVLDEEVGAETGRPLALSAGRDDQRAID